ncbi:facilitated trehalose transporter Tret1-like isoform X1 [Vanessa atalanta]|uniref:facilitated trehalose transporter Tret1-like isoform X1 n=1 Tax=Vanessa atalanta TaxID=42275 RepID=UPI001FCE23E4|nr:facilitated trehalose transporter Tret1-like isoform X1 [Vanessa atalanta]
MSVFRQAYCTLIVCLLTFNIGLMFAWPSSTIKLFSSTNTTLNRPMGETEMALFGSLSSIAALISTPLSGFLIDVLGRKKSCILFALPQPIAWALVSTTPRVDVILASISISGLGGCMFMIAPNFISEFCQETIRGTMTSGAIIFYGIGLMVSYILGGYLSYQIMNYVCLTISVIAVVLIIILKESPTYLMKKGLDEEAAKSIAFYRSTSPNSKLVMQEMDLIRRTLNPKMDDVTPEEENLNPELQTKKKLSVIQFLKKSQSTRRALILVLMTYFTTIFQGLVVVQVYSEPVFEEALPSMSANLASILFALTNTISGFVSAYLLDYLGRRPVSIYSSIASSICCVALGAQIHLQWGPLWLTGVLLYAYCITATIGAGTVPYVIIAELFLPEVKGIMTMLTVQWAWICNFIILFIFNPLNAAIGLGPVFYIFGIFSLLSSIVSFIYLPETKGLTVDVIQTLLVKAKKSEKA